MGGDQLVAHVAGVEVEARVGDEARAGWEREYGRLMDEVSAFEHAADLVRAIADDGLLVALASSAKSTFTEGALRALALTEDDFAAVTTGDDAERSKPEPDILSVALEAAGGRHAVVVGDSPWDVKAAQRLGMACVCVRSGGFSSAELRDAGAAHVVDDVGELLAFDWRSVGGPAH